ncbi:hypothetical protein BHAOGJBA_2916 [Methylobacterium hispanicum]|uniref:Metallophosphoesterase n=1 Tax=Methylobacterium hispanicum TaxID=270350 RepID=A0AAV4ZLK7_9HYPH|nr:hypothetical protein [Methylobacterium hispanicum]GJD89389.1 hypothetical protein BHAOGJBA_2916 [Methylobacterium hispanicum]
MTAWTERLPVIDAGGLLFIGDPHLGSTKPGRRKDVDYGATVLGAVAQAIAIADARRLVPVFLGDIYDRPYVEDERLKTRLTRILAGCWTTPVTNTGNHDKANDMLEDCDSLALLAAGGTISVVRTSGPVCVYRIGELRVGLGATPYGQTIPTDVRDAFPEVDTVVWITHHDVALEGAYPGALVPHAIEGCALVVNGHMHLRKPLVTCGPTVWFNTGNITQTAVDALDHVPTVFELTGDCEIVPHVLDLPTGTDLFDLTGLQIAPAKPTAIGEPIARSVVEAAPASAFVELLKNQATLEMGRSGDGSLLREAIQTRFEADDVPPEVRAAILSLWARASDQIGATAGN